MNFPYQIVSFFDKRPNIGGFVCEGEKGWFPQVALKRRFDFADLTEKEMLMELEKFLSLQEAFTISFLQAVQLPLMPVEVIEIKQTPGIMGFHTGLLEHFGSRIVSKFSDREGSSYSPHMTISWQGQRVVDPAEFENTEVTVSEVWILKDNSDDSRVLARYPLKELRH